MALVLGRVAGARRGYSTERYQQLVKGTISNSPRITYMPLIGNA